MADKLIFPQIKQLILNYSYNNKQQDNPIHDIYKETSFFVMISENAGPN